MSGNKVIKSVSFNLTVKDDAAMLKHVKRKNFSGYVKKLILKDMNKEVVESVDEVAEVEIAIEQPKKETPQEKLERLKAKKSESKPAPPKLLLNPPKN